MDVVLMSGSTIANIIQMATVVIIMIILSFDLNHIKKYIPLFIIIIVNFLGNILLTIVVFILFPSVSIRNIQSILLFTTLIIYLILLQRLMEKYDFFNRRRKILVIADWCLVGFSLFMALLPFLIVYFLEHEESSALALTMILIAIGLIIVSIISALFRQKERLKYEFEQRYILDVEERQLEIRRFRHDYLNLLLILDRYFEEDDIPGVKDYFYDEIMPTGEFLRAQNIELGNLANLKINEIKSLFSIKLMEAQSNNIETIVDIPNEIGSIGVKYSILTRIIGILLDNAIEECILCEKPVLNIGIFEKAKEQKIIIKNTCRENHLTTRQMFEKDFSTKGKGRGLGLSNVRYLLDRLEHVSIKTINENGYFVQELRILTGGE